MTVKCVTCPGNHTEAARTERGWPGHFCMCQRCGFRRNTLVSCFYTDGLLGSNGRHIVVSTVGQYRPRSEKEMVGVFADRYYETMIFVATLQGCYFDADVMQQITLPLPWSITAKSVGELPPNVDILADEMHESNVEYVQQHFDELYPSQEREPL